MTHAKNPDVSTDIGGSSATSGEHDPQTVSHAPAGTNRRMAVRQSNHDVWTLPDCLVALCDTQTLPLWEAVARWTLREGRGVSRDEVAQAFRITPRRASDTMRYILLSQADVVTCSSLVVRREGGGRQMLFCVTHMTDGPRHRRGTTRHSPVSTGVAARRRTAAALRKAFLRKVMGGQE